MADANEPPPGDASDPTDELTKPRAGARTLDRRTIAICACIGLIAAIVTGLLLSIATKDDGGRASDDMTLEEPHDIDTTRLLAQPLDAPDGGTTTLGDHLAGKPLLVNIWATSCEPCRTEMPMLQRAADDNPGVTFVGVSTQDRPEAAAAFAEDKIEYPWALDPTGEFFYEAKGAGMPTTLLLSADGDVLATKTGRFKDASQLQAFIDKAG